MTRLAVLAALLGIPLALSATDVLAQDKLKVAIPMRGNWENAAPDLGERAGIFKKHGFELEKVYTQGTGETIQVVISGSVDIGLAIGAFEHVYHPVSNAHSIQKSLEVKRKLLDVLHRARIIGDRTKS